MGKFPYVTDSDEAEGTSSSVENLRNKKRFSILKYTSGNLKKKKCKVHAKSEPDESDYHARSRSSSNHRVRYNLPGILKYDRDRESSDEDEDIEPVKPRSQARCLVGRVPRPHGAKPGRGGGVAIIVKKNMSNCLQSSVQPQASTSSARRKYSYKKRLTRKRSY